MPDAARRYIRLVGITRALAEDWHTRAELAGRFDVSERRITSDLAVLEAAGIGINRKYGSGYRIFDSGLCNR